MKDNYHFIRRSMMVLFVIFLLTNNHIHAQVNIGFTAGVNFPNWIMKKDGNVYPTLMEKSSLIGGFINYRFDDVLSIQAELLYQGMGAQSNLIHYHQQYITSPFLLKFDLKNLLYIETGPQLGYLIDANSNIESIKSDFKQMDVQYIVGVGVYLTNRIDLGVRYGYGLMEVSNGNKFYSIGKVSDLGIKNQSLGLVFSYYF